MSGPAAGTRMLLVRHGQSTWNAEGRWQGQADPPLSALGREQAAEAAARVDPVDTLWSSDLRRAQETAEIIGAHAGLPVCLEGRLRERDAGEWAGLTRAEIEERWPGYLAAGRRPPGFEPNERLLGRVVEGVDAIARLHGGQAILVVTHGGIVRILERHLGATDRPLLSNLGGRWIEAAAGGGSWALGKQVLLLDDVTVTRPGQI